MAELRTAQQFQSIDQARDEVSRLKTADRRRAEAIDRFLNEETILALVSDYPDATRPAVQAVLAGKSLKDARLHTQIVNAQRALAQLKEYLVSGEELAEPLLPALHRQLLEGVDSAAGQYRPGPTKPILPGPPPMDAAFVPRALHNTYQWVATASFTDIHAVEQAALIGARLLEVQPFAAGNIKAVQLTASLLLMRQGFPPVIFRREEHPAFLHALGLAFMLSMQDLIDLYVQALHRLLNEAVRQKG